jgi:hypothetical protein
MDCTWCSVAHPIETSLNDTPSLLATTFEWQQVPYICMLFGVFKINTVFSPRKVTEELNAAIC